MSDTMHELTVVGFQELPERVTEGGEGGEGVKHYGLGVMVGGAFFF